MFRTRQLLAGVVGLPRATSYARVLDAQGRRETLDQARAGSISNVAFPLTSPVENAAIAMDFCAGRR
ncbi:hypothetical protein D3C78_1553020 [compost metagenome]